MSDFNEVLTDLAPPDHSEIVTAVRDVTVAYAAGRFGLDKYSAAILALRDVDCSRCGQVRWQYELPHADGDGAENLCHDCYWQQGEGFADRKEQLRNRASVEFGLGLVMRELMSAFRERHLSVEYSLAGQVLVVIYSPLEQCCERIVQVPGEMPRYCGEETSARACPVCWAAMPDAEEQWERLVEQARERAAKEQPPTTEEQGDE